MFGKEFIDYTIKKDHYGRRIIPKISTEDRFCAWNTGLVPAQSLRTNSRLLAIIQSGGEIPPTSDPKTYADPGHTLEGFTSEERYLSSLGLPLHNYRESPTSRFAISRDDVRRAVRDAVEQASDIRAKGSVQDAADLAVARPSDAQ